MPTSYDVTEYSVLKYIDVSVTGDGSDVFKYVKGLCDSGREICTIKSALIEDFSPDVVKQTIACFLRSACCS